MSRARRKSAIVKWAGLVENAQLAHTARPAPRTETLNKTTARSPASADTGSTDKLESPLLQAGDPAPFEIFNAQGRARVLLVADHASNFIPASLRQLGVEDWVLERHVALDIGSAHLTRALARLIDAPALLTNFSRLVIDANRQPDDPTACLAVSDGISVPGNQGLSAVQRAQRVRTFFAPYHEAIDFRLRCFDEANIVPAMVSIHSCTPVFAGFSRPWHIGVMWDKDSRIAFPLMRKLRENPDVCLGDNEPYSGRHSHDFTIDHHAESRGLPHVGIEVRQDLIANDEGAEAWAAVLAGGLRAALADDAVYSLWQS